MGILASSKLVCSSRHTPSPSCMLVGVRIHVVGDRMLVGGHIHEVGVLVDVHIHVVGDHMLVGGHNHVVGVLVGGHNHVVDEQVGDHIPHRILEDRSVVGVLVDVHIHAVGDRMLVGDHMLVGVHMLVPSLLSFHAGCAPKDLANHASSFCHIRVGVHSHVGVCRPRVWLNLGFLHMVASGLGSLEHVLDKLFRKHRILRNLDICYHCVVPMSHTSLV